jgi:hypothetical protein
MCVDLSIISAEDVMCVDLSVISTEDVMCVDLSEPDRIFPRNTAAVLVRPQMFSITMLVVMTTNNIVIFTSSCPPPDVKSICF